MRLVLATLFTESLADFKNVNQDFGRAISTKKKKKKKKGC
jgi:hypothetical protein